MVLGTILEGTLCRVYDCLTTIWWTLKLTQNEERGISRYTLPPCTTKKRTTTNVKTKNNQNCHKIELYGSPTTKELKKKHSLGLVGRMEMGSWGREVVWQGGSWRTGQSHIYVWINQEEQLGSETDHAAQGSSIGKWTLKTSGYKNPWELKRQEKLPASQESSLERPMGS